MSNRNSLIFGIEEKTYRVTDLENRLVLLDFYTDWCGSCQTLNPVVQFVEKSFPDQLKVLRINADENKTLTASFKIRSVPTLVLFKEGEMVWRVSGLVTQRELVQKISKSLNV